MHLMPMMPEVVCPACVTWMSLIVYASTAAFTSAGTIPRYLPHAERRGT